MMDLLLRLIRCVEPAELRQEVLRWLDKSKVIQRLVELISPSQDEDRQSNASQTLCDIIRLSRDQSNQLQEAAELDPLLAVLESQECVEQLLKNMFDGELTENCLVNGTQVLLTLLEPRRAGVEGLMDSALQGAECSFVVNSSILRGIGPRLKDFHRLLLTPPKRSSILTTIGVLEEPLGNARLHGARLIAALLHTDTAAINQELCRLNTMDLLLDLFFKYTWNNFLHFQVELCIAVILAPSTNESNAATKQTENNEGLDGGATAENFEASDSHPENIMVTHLFQTCCLVQRILDAWEANDKIQAEGGMRRGNMGHLTRIANTVVQNMEKGPMQAQICQFVRGLPEDCRGRWESFVEETLTEANRRNTVDLVSTHHLHSSSEDEDLEAAFPSDLSLQQAFSEYQIQQMTANFVDQFGFNDEEFADQDDNINAPFDRIAEISFNIDADDDSPNASLFEACCSERIQPFGDNEEEEEEDIWEEKEISYATQVKSRTRFGASPSSAESSKSDLHNGDQDDHGDSGGEEAGQVSSSTTAGADEDGSLLEQRKSSSGGSEWTAMSELGSATSCVAMDVGSSVWDSAAADLKPPEERGWAKFADFQPFCCSEAGPRCSSPVEAESSDLEGNAKQSQDENFNAASPCAWSICLAQKAPLVAPDSEEEEAGVVTGTFCAVSGQEATHLPGDAVTEKPVCTSTADSMAVDKLTIVEAGSCKPQSCVDHLHVAAAATEARRDREEELLPISEAALNGPS
ncbi:serine/threonine-protein phosphatase 6 regulatory subunit 2 isoform X2 [Paroedura picta]